jgi:hypothetical protein
MNGGSRLTCSGCHGWWMETNGLTTLLIAKMMEVESLEYFSGIDSSVCRGIWFRDKSLNFS